MPNPTPYTTGGVTVTAGSTVSVQVPPQVFLGRMTGLLFDTNKTFLLPRSLSGIRGLRSFFDRRPKTQVLVVGHTDTVGPAQSNLTLSIERAVSIKAYLLDDVETWMEFYPGRPGSAHWGVTEDQNMLTELGFYSGPINGTLDGPTRDAVRSFQQSKGLAADGKPGQNTRRALITAYMQVPNTSLPPGTVVQTHGCGKFHLAVQTADNVAEERNRRVEVFFFELRIDPPPRARCPDPGCPERAEWLRRTVQTFDLEHPPGALDVVVQDPSNQPVPGAAVHASGPTAADGQSDAQGRVHFDDLLPGTYTLLAQKAGFQNGTGQAAVGPGASADAAPAPPASTVVQLQAATGALHVRTRNAAGSPIAGAQLTVQNSVGAQVGSATTSATGEADFPGLAAGNHTVGATASGFVPQQVPAQILPATNNLLDLTLQVATGSLQVRITDSLGGALAGATVSVTPASGTAPTPQTTDASGNTTFSALEVGTAQLSVTRTGFDQGSGSATVVANASASVTVQLTANTAELVVSVTSSVGGGALSGAAVDVTGGNPGSSNGATTDASGGARFPALALGSYTATVSLADFTTAIRTTTVQRNATNLLAVVLTPSIGTLLVQVKDNLGAPLSGVSVQVTPASGTALPAATTNAQGQATFNRVPVGNVSVQGSKSGFVTNTGTGAVPPGAQGQVTLALQPAVMPVVIRVESTAPGNPALSGVALSIAGPTSLSISSDANGAANTNLLPGTYTITATALDNFTAPAPISFNVTTTASNSVRVQLTPNAVTAQITPAPLSLLLKKHGCSPARVPVVLRATNTFTGTTSTGKLTRSSASVKLFTALTGGAEITNTTNNVFTAAQLAAAAGHTIFAEGAVVSAKTEDVTLTLDLFVGTNAFGTSGTAKATVFELNLELFQSRTNRSEPASMKPPAPNAPDVAKIDRGRFLHMQDPGFHQGRALLVVREVQPAGFKQTLQLGLVAPAPGAVAPGAVQLFPAEVHVPGEGAAPLPQTFTPAQLAAAPQVAGARGLAFFVEGLTASSGLRDVQLQLGVQGGELDGDRAAFTVVKFTNLTATVPSTPSPRTGAIPAHAPFVIAGTAAAHFDEDFIVNRPLVLLQNSVDAAGPVLLSVTVAPPGVTVSWSALRDTRPAGAGAHVNDGDAPGVIALAPAAAPAVTSTGATTASLQTDAVGSFRIRAFVNDNATAGFDRDPATVDSFSPDPFLLLNLVLVHVKLDHDDVQVHQTLVAVANGGGIFASSGVFNLAGAPNNTALHHNAQLTLIGGGRNGRLGTDRVFGGWLQDAVAAIGHRGVYLDTSGLIPAVHPLITVQENPRRGALPPTTTPSVTPGQAAPAIFPTPPPILDSGRLAAGQGGLTGCLGQSNISARADVALGEQLRIEAVDSPAMPYPARHPGFASARLTFFHFEMRFRALLSFWANNSNPPNPGSNGATAERLYVVALEVPWTMLGEWDVNPGSGAVTIHAPAPSVVMPANVPHTPAVSARSLGVEPTVSPGTSTWLGTWIHDARN